MALPRINPVASFWRLAADDPATTWELWAGEPRAKESMSFEHGDLGPELAFQLRSQLDRAVWRLRVNHGRLPYAERHAFVPDLAVIPAAEGLAQAGQPGWAERYASPLPLVVEIWSRSTGGYDLRVKLAAYQARGDREIWRLHPYDRTLTRWLRQEDGTYLELVHTGGRVELAALPGVAIDLHALFAE
jgi:Uma2 family endonuclease